MSRMLNRLNTGIFSFVYKNSFVYTFSFVDNLSFVYKNCTQTKGVLCTQTKDCTQTKGIVFGNILMVSGSWCLLSHL